MPKAAVVYRSRTGTTHALAEEIAAFLAERGIESRVLSVGECTDEALADLDYLLLGCWTHGLFVICQHPDDRWVEFAHRLPPLGTARVGLFTTYKLVTGSMFRKMRRHLRGKVKDIGLELKSRNGRLSDGQQRALLRFIGAGPG